jgi:MFS family permease
MQKLSASKWLSVNIFIWGGICMALGGCKNFPSLAALRFILGMLEACSTPAFLLITAMWYTVDEQPIRIGYWSTFLGLANSFGGLLAYGIGHINGSLETWRYQFIIIGAVSSAWGLFMYFFLAETPVTAYVLNSLFIIPTTNYHSSWLSPDEKKMAVGRLSGNNTGLKTPAFKSYQLIEALLDPKTWLLVLFGLSTQVVNGAVSNFGTFIIKGFGYSSLVSCDDPAADPLRSNHHLRSSLLDVCPETSPGRKTVLCCCSLCPPCTGWCMCYPCFTTYKWQGEIGMLLRS